MERNRNWRLYRLFPVQDELPRKAGCYAIYLDGQLVYIGQSNDIRNRFSEHKIRYCYSKEVATPWGDFPDTSIITVKVKESRRLGDWAMWEIRLIRRLRPVFNRHHRRARAA